MFEKTDKAAVEKAVVVMSAIVDRNPNLVHCKFALGYLDDIVKCLSHEPTPLLAMEHYCSRAVHELALIVSGLVNNRSCHLEVAAVIARILADVFFVDAKFSVEDILPYADGLED